MYGRRFAGVVSVVATAGFCSISTPSMSTPSPQVQAHEVRLVDVDTADSSLGDGTALILGPSGIPIPSQSYIDTAASLYLESRGFTGTAQGLDTPEGLYPITGVHSLEDATSNLQDEQILDSAIEQQIAAGHVDAADPVTVFGWSQSSVASTLLMPQLASQGVPADDVHFVLVGDESAPNGGILERFDVPAGSDPSIPSFGLVFTGAQANDLYPTDVYSNEYDGFTDFPQYPANLLSDLNALLGIVFDHTAYLGDTPQQIADAIPLPTSAADTLTDYYMMPTTTLPLLEPLLLFGNDGKALYDLLEPDTKILVDLGYGNVDTVSDIENGLGGWSTGDADVATPFALSPDASVLEQLPQALANGLQLGITDAAQDLQNPESSALILDNSQLEQLVASANGVGLTDDTSASQLLTDPSALLSLAKSLLGSFANFPISDATLTSSPTDILNDLSATLSADYASLLPIADAANALLTTLPTYDANIFLDQLEAGNLLGAIGDPIAADTALIPLALVFGLSAPLESLGGTLLNLVDLIPTA